MLKHLFIVEMDIEIKEFSSFKDFIFDCFILYESQLQVYA